MSVEASDGTEFSQEMWAPKPAKFGSQGSHDRETTGCGC